MERAMSDANSNVTTTRRIGRPHTVAMSAERSRKAPWFVVPEYTTNLNPRMDCTVINRYGEHVAHFENIEDARFVVAAINGVQQ